VITRLSNLTCLRKTLRVSSSHLENPAGFPQIPQPRRRPAILGVHQNGAGSEVNEQFISATTYTPLGMVAGVTYPQVTYPTPSWYGTAPPARVVSYDYDYGWLTGVHEGATHFASGFDYYPSGLVHEFVHGNGVVERATIDTTTYIPRPMTIETVGASTDWSTTYTYDSAGNITTWGAADNAYDRLGRLISSEISGERSEYLEYDGFGNMTQRMEFGGGYDETTNFTVSTSTNRITNMGISYDTAGNITDFGAAASIVVNYNALDQPVKIDSTNDQYQFFDVDGKRAVEFGGGRYTYILRDHDGEPLRRISLVEGSPDWT